MMKSWAFWISLALVAITFAAYAQVGQHDFVIFDDPDYVRDNQWVKQGLTVNGIVWAFTTGHASNWHPVTWLSFMIETEIHRFLSLALGFVFHKDRDGLFPGAYALMNVAIHAINGVLLFGVLRLMTGALWRSAFVAAILAVHPMHVESVAWISERKDVLSMLFMLLTFRAYFRYVGDRNWRSYLAVMVMFALGLMSKPMLVTLPAVLLLLDYWPLRRIRFGNEPKQLMSAKPMFLIASIGASSAMRVRNAIVEKIPLCALAAIASVITMVLQVYGKAAIDGVGVSIVGRVQNVAVSYVRYIGKLLWPTELAMLYPNPALVGKEFWSPLQVGSAVALLLTITILAFILGWRRRYLIVGWLWYLGTMVPVIGFVHIGRHSLADRYAYIPYIGLYILIMWGFADATARLKWRSQLAIVLGGVAVASCMLLTFEQVKHWRNSDALFGHTLQITEENWAIHSGTSLLLCAKAGEMARTEEMGIEEVMKQATWHAEEAVRINPYTYWLHENLADIYDRSNRLREAQQHLEEAVRLNPERARLHWSLALVLAKRGQALPAIEHGQRAIELEPDSAEAHLYYGIVLSEFNRLDEALQQFENAFGRDPKLQRLHGTTHAHIKAARDAQHP